MNADDVLRQQLQTAPPAIKTILTTRSWSAVVDEIADANRFSEDQKNSLENEVLFVLLGMELRAKLGRRITKELQIERSRANTIASELDRRVFGPVVALLPTREERDLWGSIKSLFSRS